MKSRRGSSIGLVVLVLIALVVPAAMATDDPKVQATVSFGQWQTDPSLDDGTQPGDINTSLLEPGSDPPGLIADPHRRIFRGIDPRKQPVLPNTVPGQMNQDRVESVRFLKPGRYLVIGAVHPHFVNDGMFGFVKVTAQDKDD